MPSINLCNFHKYIYIGLHTSYICYIILQNANLLDANSVCNDRVFARESGGKVTNAGCLDHFRKRLVMALRAVPGLDKMTEGEREWIPAYVIWKKLNAVFMLDRKTKEFGTKEERDAYRDGTVREAFDGLAASVREAGAAGSPKGSYLSGAVTYFTNQEVYLREFMDDSNIASNNSKAERNLLSLPCFETRSRCSDRSGARRMPHAWNPWSRLPGNMWGTQGSITST